MCGIVGIVAKNNYGFNKKELEMFDSMLIAGQLRGAHGTGMFRVDKGLGTRDVDWLKLCRATGEFRQTQGYFPFLQNALNGGQLVVGHNRFATVGGNATSATAHPFQVKNITLVHNGFVKNTDLKLTKSKVDSESFTHDLQAAGDDFPDLIRDVDGAFCFVWYNSKDKKLRITRNNQRPLTMWETPFGWAFCSERKMGEWLLDRSDFKFCKEKFINDGVIYEIDMSVQHNRTINEIRVPVKKYQVTTYQTSPSNLGTPFAFGSDDEDNVADEQFARNAFRQTITKAIVAANTPVKQHPIRSRFKTGTNIVFSLYDREFLEKEKQFLYKGIHEAPNQDDVEVFFMSKNELPDTTLEAPLVEGEINCIHEDKIQVRARSVLPLDIVDIPNDIPEDTGATLTVKLKDGTVMTQGMYSRYKVDKCCSCKSELPEDPTDCAFSQGMSGIMCSSCVADLENAGCYPHGTVQ